MSHFAGRFGQTQQEFTMSPLLPLGICLSLFLNLIMCFGLGVIFVSSEG